MVVAIDGPAGAGKSTVSRQLAASLGFRHLDTGAMYRAVALVSLERGITPGEAAAGVLIEPGPPLTVDGVAPGDAIRTTEVTAAASRVAADPEVRRLLVARQRQILSIGDWVAEGRDICEVVAPDAEVRVWLTADEVERARRRAAQTGGDPDEILAAQRSRDAADSGHGRSTLEAPSGAAVLDTTSMSAEEVIASLREMVNTAS